MKKLFLDPKVKETWEKNNKFLSRILDNKLRQFTFFLILKQVTTACVIFKLLPELLIA